MAKKMDSRLDVVIPTRLCRKDAKRIRDLAQERGMSPAALVRIFVRKALARLKETS